MPSHASSSASAILLAAATSIAAEPQEATLLVVNGVEARTTTIDGESFTIDPYPDSTIPFVFAPAPDGNTFWAGLRLNGPGSDGQTSRPGFVRLDFDSLSWTSVINDIEIDGVTAVATRFTRAEVSNRSITARIEIVHPQLGSEDVMLNWNSHTNAFKAIGVTDQVLADQEGLPAIIESMRFVREREPGRSLFLGTANGTYLFTHEAGTTETLWNAGEPVPGYPDLVLSPLDEMSVPGASGRVLLLFGALGGGERNCAILLTESNEFVRIACGGDPSPLGDPYGSFGQVSSVGMGGLRAFDDGSLVFPVYIDRGNPPNFDFSLVYQDADGDQILLRTGGPKFPGTDHRQWQFESHESRSGWMAVELGMAPWNGAPEHRDVALLHGKAPNLSVAYIEGDLLPGSTSERWAPTDYEPSFNDPRGPFSIQEVAASGDVLFNATVEVDGVVEQRTYIRNGQTGELRRAPRDPMIVSRTAVPGNWTFQPTWVQQMFDDGSLLVFGSATRLEPGATPQDALAILRSPSGTPCNVADTRPPFGVLDLSDIDTFVAAFSVANPASDIAAPFGVVDLADVDAFIGAFLAGCS